MTKEEYLKERDENAQNELSSVIAYEYYLEHRDENYKKLDLGEFVLVFQEFLKMPMVTGTDKRMKMVRPYNIRKKIIDYFDQKFNT